MRHWVAICVFAVAASGCSSNDPAPTSLDQAYLAIGDKLAADNIDDLDKLAATVVAAAEPRQTETGVPDLVAGAGRVAAQDIAAARTAFQKMSAGMIEYLAAHPDQRTGLQLVHCTMTFGGQGGYWVQREGKVMNPYEGATMLHCGDVTPWQDGPKT